MPKNQNYPPFNDDYDQSKNFHQILFKPGVAVQARELTQVQTILQSQIERFGNHVFKSGSKVTGGDIHVNQNVFSVKLLPSYAGSGVSVTGLEGKYAKGRTSGLIGEIVMALSSDGSDPATLVFQSRVVGSNSGLFTNSEIIDIFSDQTCTTATGTVVQAAGGTSSTTSGTTVKLLNKINVASGVGISVGDRVVHPRAPVGTFVTKITGNVVETNIAFSSDIPSSVFVFANDATKPTMIVSITEGVFYIEGYFVYCAPQQMVLDKYIRTPSYVVGLRYSESIITSDDDASLLDNAQGAYNYAAPGADRLSLPLLLDKVSLDVTTGNNFVELIRINEGAVERQTSFPIYADLQKELSRRTFEESGNYVVRPFTLNLKDDTRYASALLAELSPGKAYVNGDEIETISTSQLRLDRAQDFESVSGFDVSAFYGSHMKVTGPTASIPNLSAGIAIELHNVTTGYSAATQVGTANVRFLSYDSGTGANAVYRAYLFNVKLTGALTFASTRSLITSAAPGVYTTITAKMVVDASGIVASNAILFDSDQNKLVFPIPHAFTKTVSVASYKTKRVFKSVAFSGGVATLTTNNGTERFAGGSGLLPSTVALQNYNVTTITAAGALAAGAFVPLDLSSRTVTVPVVPAGVPGQVTIDLKDAAFNGTSDIVTTIDITGDARRVKTLVTGQQYGISVPASTMSLLKSDVSKVTAIYMSPSLTTDATIAHTDVTANYIVDNGQRDTHYDHGTITLRPGLVPATGRLLVVFDYFTHSGGTGFFSVDSYGVAYQDIPAYTTSTGDVIQLRDAYDFRPRRTDGSATLLFNSFQLPDATIVDSFHSYYLARIDKIVMSADGKFKVLKGISNYNNPQPPSDLEDGMTIATLQMPPYTLSANLVKVTYENNRRYTMKDIAKLDARLGNIEYYTALSSLEKNVLDKTLTDAQGNGLFKNGFLSDSFTSFEVSDVGNADFRAAIDTVRGFARPPFKLTNLALAFDSLSSNAKKTGDLVTATYAEAALIRQNLASKYVNVNPFNVLSNVGILTLTPSSDVWYETKTLPVVNVLDDNTAAFKTAQTNALALNQSASWGEWSTYWTGTSVDGAGNTISTEQQARFKPAFDVTSSTTTTTNTSVVSTDLVPYLREKTISFDVSGMIPYSNLYCWMDGVNLSLYVTPDTKPIGHTGITSIAVSNGGSGFTGVPTVAITGGGGTGATGVAVVVANQVSKILITTFGSGYTSAPTVAITGGGGTGAVATASIITPSEGMELNSDVNGRATGKLRIPNDTLVKFASGSKRIIFSDNTNSVFESSSFSDAVYLAQGYINNTQKTIISTRMPVISTDNVRDTRANSSVISTYIPASRDNYNPPDAASLTPRVFDDSPISLATFVGMIVNKTGVSTATATSVANGVVSAYNVSAAANPDRAYGNQVGLPDLQGALWWAVNSINNNVDANTVTTQGILSAITPTGTEAAAWKALNCAGRADPLAQTFFVDGNRNPQGVFISSVDLFFASKDTINPVTLEIRPVVNGYPSASIIVPFSQIVMPPASVNVSTLGDAATNFKFSSPIFLAPGEYSMVVKTNSNKYNLFVAELGAVILGTTRTITQQPYVGSLFKSQNATTWTAVQEEDLCFTMYKCDFDIGTTTFQLKSDAPVASFDYDLLRVTAQELDFGNTTDIQVKAKTKNLATGTIGSLTPILQNSDVTYTSRNTASASGDIVVEYTLTTRSRDVSPVVDLERSSAILVQNIVNNTSDLVNLETVAYGGDAKAKHVTKKVTLAPGFDGDSLVVYLDANRPAGTSIEVYYKVQNVFDVTNFLDRPWVKMNLESGGQSTSKVGEYVEDKYGVYNLSYVNNGSTYTTFRSYQIKVVMYSSNVAVVPSFTDLRAIAAV